MMLIRQAVAPFRRFASIHDITSLSPLFRRRFYAAAHLMLPAAYADS